MGKNNVSNMFEDLKTSAIKHGPEILTGLGIAGMITSTVLAVKSTPKALKLIEERKKELETDTLEPLEVVKTTWTCYIPSLIAMGPSVACLIGANSVNAKRNAALAAAYTISEKALSRYQSAVVETIGEKKEALVREKEADDILKTNPVTKNEVIITGKDSSLCYDVIGSRYFKSDYDTIKRAENKLNNQILNEGYASLNDLYYFIDLDSITLGDDIGWSSDGKLVEIFISSKIADDGTPCLVMNFSTPPKYNFNYYA